LHELERIAFEVSTILTATVSAADSAAIATAVSGLPGSFVMTGVSGADPPGSSFFSSSTVSEQFGERPAFRCPKGVKLLDDVAFVFGSFVARSTS
jgi:hypothetical protein